ncbi:hypothetical protein T492DRAFT_881035 [Pavlovales sp. CCMP2436]|nr:hypothetical protein T492DRAFT_881035 [Pavlovales sp. CCMP2436]
MRFLSTGNALLKAGLQIELKACLNRVHAFVLDDGGPSGAESFEPHERISFPSQFPMPPWSENFRTIVFDDNYTLFKPKDLRRVLRVITKDLLIWESAELHAPLADELHGSYTLRSPMGSALR